LDLRALTVASGLVDNHLHVLTVRGSASLPCTKVLLDTEGRPGSRSSGLLQSGLRRLRPAQPDS
jgi:hypothetical protein